MIALPATISRLRASLHNRILATRRPQLLAYWPLDEASGSIAYDHSGNGLHAAYTGVDLGLVGIGDGRPCPFFDGVNDFVNLYSAGLASGFNGDEGTLSCIFQPSSAAVYGDGTTDRIIALVVGAAAQVRMTKDATANQISCVYAATATRTLAWTIPATMSPLHLVLTWSQSANAIRSYLNGGENAIYGTAPGAWVGSLAAATTAIGTNSTTTPVQMLSGKCSDVAIWTTAFNPNEIANLRIR